MKLAATVVWPSPTQPHPSGSPGPASSRRLQQRRATATRSLPPRQPASLLPPREDEIRRAPAGEEPERTNPHAVPGSLSPPVQSTRSGEEPLVPHLPLPIDPPLGAFGWLGIASLFTGGDLVGCRGLVGDSALCCGDYAAQHPPNVPLRRRRARPPGPRSRRRRRRHGLHRRRALLRPTQQLLLPPPPRSAPPPYRPQARRLLLR